MTDYVKPSKQELRAVIDSLAHDLRTRVTAIRGNLEMFLLSEPRDERVENIVSAMDQLDRLNEFLNTSLDVAEANAGTLKLTYSEIDLNASIRMMINLYEPCMSERGVSAKFRSSGPVKILADAPLLHRAFAKLFDHEAKFLPDSSTLLIRLGIENNAALLTMQSKGFRFSPAIDRGPARELNESARIDPHLGLSFVEAVVRAHRGSVTIADHGAAISIAIPIALDLQTANLSKPQ